VAAISSQLGIDTKPAMPAQQNATAAMENATQPAGEEEAAGTRQIVEPRLELYQNARQQFEKRNYEKAKDMWAEFAEKYPEHELVPNAVFWQGECFYQMREYARAVLKYQEVIDDYRDSTKYRAALLKQGISFMRLGRTKAGKLLLQDVVDKFPDSPEAKRAKIILSGN
jgi:tol-pal system protein YbgF